MPVDASSSENARLARDSRFRICGRLRCDVLGVRTQISEANGIFRRTLMAEP